MPWRARQSSVTVASGWNSASRAASSPPPAIAAPMEFFAPSGTDVTTQSNFAPSCVAATPGSAVNTSAATPIKLLIIGNSFQTNASGQHRHPAVHMQRLSGDISGFLRREIDDGGGDVAARAHPARRNPLVECFLF